MDETLIPGADPVAAEQTPQSAPLPEETRRKLLSTLGLCARARKLVTGTPMVCETMRTPGAVICVLEASDTSDNTHGKLTSKCAFYKVPHKRLPIDGGTLAHAVGKTGVVAAVGVTDKELFRSLGKYLGS